MQATMRAIRGRIGSSRSSVILSAVSLGLFVGILLLPNLAPALADPTVTQAYHGRITAHLDPHRPDPSGEGGGFLPDARVLMLEGPNQGKEIEAYLQGPGGQQDSEAYRDGEDVVVTVTDTGGGAPFIAVSDRWRVPQLLVLAAIFVAAVVLVGGWRGLRAVLGLALTIALVLKVLIPLLVNGVPPIPVAVVIAIAITILAIGLTEGIGRTSVAAILGTSAALALTAVLAAIATAAAGFTNTVGSDLVSLQLPGGQGLDLRGLLLAAFMLGSIGVLDDVTVTQAAAVDELARHGGLRGAALYRSALNVGRSHIGATVNTLFLAYAGASLPLLVFLVVGGQPGTLVLNGEAVSIEIVRTLVGSLGIVAAVPLTTVIAAWLTSSDLALTDGEPRPSSLAASRIQPAIALVGGLALIAIVTGGVAALVGPLVSNGPRSPLPQEAFGSQPPGGSPGRSVEPIASGPVTFDVATPVPLAQNGRSVGSVTVLQVAADPNPLAAGVLVVVEIRYSATAALTIDPAAWTAVTPIESGIAGKPATTQEPALGAASLKAGDSRTGWLEFPVADAPSHMALDYGSSDVTLFRVILY